MTQSGAVLHEDGGDFFQCYNCDRKYRWSAEISGRTLRCKCGSKVRCPELHDDSMTAQASLEDTVADVDLNEAFDALDSELETPVGVDAEVQEVFDAKWKYRGAFGLSLGGEVLYYGGLSILGIACAILAIILGRYFWWWIAAAVVLGPIAWWKFWVRWKHWSAGRSVMQALGDVFDDGDRQEPMG